MGLVDPGAEHADQDGIVYGKDLSCWRLDIYHQVGGIRRHGIHVQAGHEALGVG